MLLEERNDQLPPPDLEAYCISGVTVSVSVLFPFSLHRKANQSGSRLTSNGLFISARPLFVNSAL